MLSTHLWPAANILATLISPFGPAIGARVVRWARHRRILGPIVNRLFPEDEGTHLNQQDVEPQVNLNADSIEQMRDALQYAVQEGLRTAGEDQEQTAETTAIQEHNTLLQQQNTLLQQLVDTVEPMLEEVRGFRGDTYTVTATITRQVR